MACLLIIFGTLSAVYLIPTLYHDYSTLEDVDKFSRKKQAEEMFAPQEFIPPSRTKNLGLDALKEAQRKAEEQAENPEVWDGHSP